MEKEGMKGTVEAVNAVPGKEGLKIDGAWYNATDRVRPYIAKKRKGDRVYYELDAKGNLNFVGQDLGEESPKKAASHPQSGQGNASYTGDPKEDYWRQREARELANEAKRDMQNAIREWAQRRGGYSHDAAAIVAAVVRESGPVPQGATAEQAATGAADLTEKITDRLVKAAEEREEKFKKTLELGSLKPTKPIEGEP